MNRRAFILLISLLSACAIMFRSFFKNRSTPDSKNLRDRVLKIAKAAYPAIPFDAPADNPDVIMANRMQIGLQNLKAKFEQSDRSEQTLEQLVVQHLDIILKGKQSASDVAFDIAREKLRPQLMPPEFARQALLPIISFPFGKAVTIGIVLDDEKAYAYVRREDAVRWKKSEKELLDLAITNLDAASRGIQMNSSENADSKFVAIETKDGFDAARILLPKLQQFLSDRLGSPFLFGVPNRDFLICWNVGASARFSEFTASKLQKDFAAQPYPLSSHVFQIASDGTITERA